MKVNETPNESDTARNMKYRLKEWRKRNDLTQQQVAEAIGISQGLYNQLETSKRRMNADYQNALAILYKIDPRELLDEQSSDTDIENTPKVSAIDSSETKLPVAIRRLREERGLTATQLADLVVVSVPHISGIERGIKNVNNHLLVKISEALNVQPADLISAEVDHEMAALRTTISKLGRRDRERVLKFAEALLLSQ